MIGRGQENQHHVTDDQIHTRPGQDDHEGKIKGRESFSEPACYRRFRSQASDLNLGFRGEALRSYSEISAVEPGEGHMGNVELHRHDRKRIALPCRISLRPARTD